MCPTTTDYIPEVCRTLLGQDDHIRTRLRLTLRHVQSLFNDVLATRAHEVAVGATICASVPAQKRRESEHASTHLAESRNGEISLELSDVAGRYTIVYIWWYNFVREINS